jgi:hypothetical protein
MSQYDPPFSFLEGAVDIYRYTKLSKCFVSASIMVLELFLPALLS